ncbi:NanA [Streptococcus pneumoniae]|nr:NanA [Streptococcus pneumoniae]
MTNHLTKEKSTCLAPFYTLRKSLQTPSALSATSKQCFELTSSVLFTTSKQCFEQPAASFLVCFSISIECYCLFSFIIPFFLKKRKKDFIFSKI